MPLWPVGVVSGVKRSCEALMSGGRISMPMRWHSETKTPILSVLWISLDNKAAMNSTGWFALRYAVQ